MDVTVIGLGWDRRSSWSIEGETVRVRPCGWYAMLGLFMVTSENLTPEN